MIRVNILAACSHCDGKAYLPIGEIEDSQGHKYIRHIPCPVCQGSGNEPRWVDIHDFAKLMQQAFCPHNHTSFQGNMHFSAGDIWDDIHEVCDDCGVNLEQQCLNDFANDEN